MERVPREPIRECNLLEKGESSTATMEDIKEEEESEPEAQAEPEKQNYEETDNESEIEDLNTSLDVEEHEIWMEI